MNIYDQLFASDGSVLDNVILSTALSVTPTVEASSFTTVGTYVFDSGVSADYGFPETFTGRCLLVVSGTTQPLATSQVLFANSKVWYRASATDAWKNEDGYTASELDEVTKMQEQIAGFRQMLTPIGTIVAFSGTFGGDGDRFPIPIGSVTPNTNWVLCDGVETNGIQVPDLRNRMIMGAGSTYTQGTIGGAASATFTTGGSVGDTTLTIDQMPEHQHIVPLGENSTVTGTAAYPWGSYGDNDQRGLRSNGYDDDDTWPYTSFAGGSQSHSHSFSAASRTINTLPPYYSLAYIMQIGG